MTNPALRTAILGLTLACLAGSTLADEPFTLENILAFPYPSGLVS